MFDGMHHQDQLLRQFISFSSPSPSSSSSSFRLPLPSSLHRLHHNHLQQISSPFPSNDNSSSSSFPTASPAPMSSPAPPHLNDSFHRPNLPSFHHLNPTPSSQARHNLISPKQCISDQQTTTNTSDVVDVEVPKDVGLIIRSLFPSAASSSPLHVERERRSSSPSLPQHHHQCIHQDDFWSNEEVVALLKIRSGSETSWFPPDFTWEHVSRKLAEVGFKRSAAKCKEKFEDENRTCISTTFNKKQINRDKNSYKIIRELEDLCGRDDSSENNASEADHQEENHVHRMEVEEEDEEGMECENESNKTSNVFEGGGDYVSPIIIQQSQQEPEAPSQQQLDCRERRLMKAKAKKKKIRRNKRNEKERAFEMMKGLCEGLVNKMMTQQEALHNKMLDDLQKRDEENVAREEAWKRMEVERLNTELEMRAQEQAIAGDRQAAIIDLLSTTASLSSPSQSRCFIIDDNIVAHLLKVLPKPIPDVSKFTQSHDQSPCPNLQTLLLEALEPQRTPTSTTEPNIFTKLPPTSTPPSLPHASDSTTPVDTNTRHAAVQLMINPKPSAKRALQLQDRLNNSRHVMSGEDHYGMRWPRDQVLALINLRCSFLTNQNGDHEDRDTKGSKQQAPLWERISQKMSQLGYQRSAKRCKEKWENINKYFRRTKDNVNKNRSLDSRTCPYFHQLSQLYQQGTLRAPSHDHSSPILENCCLPGEDAVGTITGQ